jgi:hypothetical protein
MSTPPTSLPLPPPPPRLLRFDQADTLYLLLNIICHDVIHDYGPTGGSEKRWEKNLSFVQQFTNSYLSFSNPSSTNDQTGGGYIEEYFDEYINTLNEMITYINNTIIFTFFNHYLDLVKHKNAPTEINFLDIAYFITPVGMTTPYKDVFDSIISKFIGFFFLTQRTEQNTYNDLLTILCDFLSYTNSTEQAIFENINLVEWDIRTLVSRIGMSSSNKERKPRDSVKKRHIDGAKKRSQKNEIRYHGERGNKITERRSRAPPLPPPPPPQWLTVNLPPTGGARDSITPVEAQTLIDRINEVGPDVDGDLNRLNTIYISYVSSPDSITPELKEEYERTRKLLLNLYYDVFKSFGQNKNAGCLYGNARILPILSNRISGRNSFSLIVNFKTNIDTLLLEYHKIVEIAKRDEEAIKQRQKRNADALTSGKLTDSDKLVRSQFCEFIAKSGLFLTGVCNSVGTINNIYNGLPSDSFLRKQINILLYIAGWMDNEGWKDVNSQELDDVLISFFNLNYQNRPNDIESRTGTTAGRYVCSRANILYVVNNAAPLVGALKTKTFCPYTSILDGMSQCSWNSAQGVIERGNMNFIIGDVSGNYYNGFLNIQPQNLSSITLGFNINANGVILSGSKDVNITGNDLEAHVVLKNTLVNVIDYIVNLDEPSRDSIFRGDNIFSNLFELFARTPASTPASTPSLFNKVYSEILFKGTGDLFQEINSVNRYGGYIDDSYACDSSKIIPYRVSGSGIWQEPLRFFAAKDRPSGTRFIFMLSRGNIEDINTKAVGGYYSKEHMLLLKHETNTDICGGITSRITGGKKKIIKTKKQKNKKNKNNKRHKNTKRKKFTFSKTSKYNKNIYM